MAYVHPPALRRPAYLAWLDANPNSYVINTERGASTSCFTRHMQLNAQVSAVHRPSYIKICSTPLDQLEEWALRHIGRAAPRCNAPGSNCWN